MNDPLADIPPEKFPRHIAIIMDGNGRWAVKRGLERIRGHQEGARTVRDIVTECARLRKHHGGPDFLTLYSFSIENWKRPLNEVSFLMTMYIEYLRKERPTMMESLAMLTPLIWMKEACPESPMISRLAVRLPAFIS